MVWRPDYLTAADVRNLVRAGSGTTDDWWYTLVASGVSRAVDKATGRQFGQVAAPEARSYPVRYSRHRGLWIADVDDLQTVAGLTGVTGYTLEPRNAVSDGYAWEYMTFTADPSDVDGYITPVASWGWATVPNAIKLAAHLQASRFVARRESPFGIAGSPQQGSELRLLERLDPDVAVDLKAYTRTWWAR